MSKKIIGIFIIFLFLPLNQAYGVSTDNSTILETKSGNCNIESSVIEMLNQINQSLLSFYLEELVEFGPRFTGTESCNLASKYIFDEFEKLGLDVYFNQWKCTKYECKNVVATLNGTDTNSDAIFIICAHYDTTETSPGANDDGSGVTAMLTLANILSKYSFNHTIRFIAFSGEEVGTFGSHAYAKKAYYNGENIIAVLNLETFGYTSGEGNELFILKTARTEWISQFSSEIAEKYYQYHNLNLISIGNRPCDHQAFLDFGYDAVQYVQLNRDDYPLHSPEDSIDKINFNYLAKVTKLLLAITAEIVKKPIDIQIRVRTPYEGYLYLLDKPIIKLPGFNFLRKYNLRAMTYIIGRAKVRVDITTEYEIESVFFCIDGISNFYGECKEPPYEWIIEKSVWHKKALKGIHNIGAYVWTKNGRVAYDEIDVFVFQLF